MSFNHGLNPGEILKNDEIASVFKCSKQGGMRRSHRTNSLILISDPTKSLYEDKWDGSVLHYTGTGQTGNQRLEFQQNRTLNESRNNGVNIYLFEVFIPTQYVYIGQFVLDAEPYQTEQIDKNGDFRLVWIFPLKAITALPIIEEEVIEKKNEIRERSVQRLSTKELRDRVQHSKGNPSKRMASSSVYERDVLVAEYVKRVANGICQLCETPAPFKDKKDNPYLESHHIVWLSRRGKDSIENSIALCPNCHKKMHVVDARKDVTELLKKASNLYSK